MDLFTLRNILDTIFVGVVLPLIHREDVSSDDGYQQGQEVAIGPGVIYVVEFDIREESLGLLEGGPVPGASSSGEVTQISDGGELVQVGGAEMLGRDDSRHPEVLLGQ